MYGVISVASFKRIKPLQKWHSRSSLIFHNSFHKCYVAVLESLTCVYICHTRKKGKLPKCQSAPMGRFIFWAKCYKLFTFVPGKPFQPSACEQGQSLAKWSTFHVLRSLVGSWLCHNTLKWAERLVWNEQFSLFRTFVNYGRKKFQNIGSWLYYLYSSWHFGSCQFLRVSTYVSGSLLRCVCVSLWFLTFELGFVPSKGCLDFKEFWEDR